MNFNNIGETKKQADLFSFVRFLAAIVIIIFHYNKITGTTHEEANMYSSLFMKLLFVHGGRLVELFFIISGFCFFLFYLERIRSQQLTFKTFMLHRLVKLLPVYWLSTVFIIFGRYASIKTIGKTISYIGSENYSAPRLVINILGLDFSNPYNGVAWFLAVNIICFFVYYWISRLSNIKFTFYLFLSLTIVAGSIVVTKLDGGNPVVNIGRGIAAFGVGLILCTINNCIVHNSRIRNVVGLCAVFVLSLVSYWLKKGYISPGHFWLTETFALFPCVVLIITNVDLLKKILLLKPFVKLGKYSFSIYIFQIPAMMLLYWIGTCLNADWHMSSVFVMSVLFVVSFGIVMYYCIEKPATFFISRK